VLTNGEFGLVSLIKNHPRRAAIRLRSLFLIVSNYKREKEEFKDERGAAAYAKIYEHETGGLDIQNYDATLADLELRSFS